MPKTHLMLVLMMGGILLASQPVGAAALSSVLTDPVGDAFIGGVPQRPGEPFQDLVLVSISLSGGRFVFVMQLAGPIPDAPALPPRVTLFYWAWYISTNHSTYPQGFPFAPGFAEQAEFNVMITWDGVKFSLNVVDRTPLLFGQDVILTELPFDIKGSEFKATVNAAILGNPSRFCWIAFTMDWPTQLGTDSFLPVDMAFEGIWRDCQLNGL